MTWNSIRLNFLKKTSMLNPVKSLRFIKYHSSGSPRPVKSSSNSIRCSCHKIWSWSRRPKTILEIRKRPHFCRWSTILLFTSFFKDFSNHRKVTNRAALFSCWPFPNMLVCKKVLAYSSLEPPLEYNQQGLTNCMHGDDCAFNMHAKSSPCAQNYKHINQSKHL